MLNGLNAAGLAPFRNEVKNHFPRDADKADPGNQAGVSSRAAGSDRVSLGQGRSEAVTYSPDLKEIAAASRYDFLRSLLVEALQEQGIATRVARGDSTIDIETLSRQDAQKLVAEDGYFGVEKTAERIFSFAAGLVDGDPERIEAVRRGIEQGFAEAEKAFGGTLPEISYKTRDRLTEKLDALAESLTSPS